LIAVVHLVWGPLGPRRLREFVMSYRAHPPGVEHDLVVLFNGVDAECADELSAELQGVDHRKLVLDQPRQDLAAYAAAAATLSHESLCFLNSYSAVLSDDWLAKFSSALEEPGVGLVGATGSWASMRSYAFYYLGLPSPYRSVWHDRRSMIREFRELDGERTGNAPPPGITAHLHTARALMSMVVGFASFPSPHIRTNAFMASRSLCRRLLAGSLAQKVQAHRQESGSNGITRCVERAGYRVLVVDREGQTFEARNWPESNTFWQGQQDRLLVSDNQTATYRDGTTARRTLLSTYAWGDRAAPAPADA
jgi:hypothetical protein